MAWVMHLGGYSQACEHPQTTRKKEKTYLLQKMCPHIVVVRSSQDSLKHNLQCKDCVLESQLEDRDFKWVVVGGGDLTGCGGNWVGILLTKPTNGAKIRSGSCGQETPAINYSLLSLTPQVASASALSSNNFSSKMLSENWNGIFCSWGDGVKFVGLEFVVA